MKKRLLSFILVVIMITGCISSIPAFATGEIEESNVDYEYLDLDFAELMATKNIEIDPKDPPTERDLEGMFNTGSGGQGGYLNNSIVDKEEKLEEMFLVYSAYGYDMYFDRVSAEVAVKNTKTGQVLFTNPYDINTGNSSEAVKKELMSQIIIKYTDMSNGNEYEMLSYTDAAVKLQVSTKYIRGGIRVEYTMGREESRKLVPRRIEKSRFEDMITSKIKSKEEKVYLESFYQLRDLSDPTLTEEERAAIRNMYPIADQMAFYVIDAKITEYELLRLENIIKKYTQYSFDDMMSDHSETMYEGTENASALFKLALEYYIEQDGLRVRLPAKGIRYDSSSFTLNNIIILPYIGAGRQGDIGYTMIPDGSGALIRFEDIGSEYVSVSSKIYGQDFAFHEVSGQNMEIWRMPVFGLIKDNVEDGSSEGFVAILTEGESLAEITSEHGGSLHQYHSVYTTVYPRQKDSYILDGVSATGSSDKWTVESPRKYTGNYTLKFVFLSGEEASYAGMANKYRDHLIKTGQLTKFEDADKDIPLYIENFGMVQTTKKRFGLPVEEDTPLTTFAQSKEILESLKAKGINNINLILSGWSNGGLKSGPVTKLEIEKVLGGKKGLNELNDYAKSNEIGLFPSFDYTYVRRSTDSTFDGFNVKTDTAKTIDNRTASKKVYSALYQAFEPSGLLLISPNKFIPFYEKISDKYQKLNVSGMALQTLGSDINSDHNEDNPLNREDSKKLISEFLERVDNDGYEILTSAGNSYTYKYADHIVDVPLDSSERQTTSETIPFIGMVLHGCVEFTGTALNLSGDYKYNVLKTIENGASPYFILSYDNTSDLKNTSFNKYYAVKFGTWFGEQTDDNGEKSYTGGDVLETYNTLNEALKPIRTATVKSHDFIGKNIVKMTYDNGVSYILNYNNKPVTVEGYELDALDFVVIK